MGRNRACGYAARGKGVSCVRIATWILAAWRIGRNPPRARNAPRPRLGGCLSPPIRQASSRARLPSLAPRLSPLRARARPSSRAPLLRLAARFEALDATLCRARSLSRDSRPPRVSHDPPPALPPHLRGAMTRYFARARRSAFFAGMVATGGVYVYAKVRDRSSGGDRDRGTISVGVASDLRGRCRRDP